MKKFLTLIIILTVLSFSQETDECDEDTWPYYTIGINSRIEGESPTLRKIFKDIQVSKSNIVPANGFITLRLTVSKTGRLCDIESFQIDENYQSTEFNSGELIKELERIAVGLKGWQRDKDFKTFNLIRFKIKEGKIEEIF